MELIGAAVMAVLLLGAVVWIYERRLEDARDVIGALRGDLERERAENTKLLRQIAGIDPTPEQLRTDLLEQLGQPPATDPDPRRLGNVGEFRPGPLPATPSRWEQPADDYFEDPTDLTAPLDALPDSWAGIEAPQLSWGPDEQLPAPEPVPEGEFRPRIVGMGLDENPLEELGIQPVWRDE